MPTNAPPVDQLTLNDLVPGERPPPDALGLDDIVPGTFRPEPEDLAWSDAMPTLGEPPNAALTVPGPPKSLWRRAKEMARGSISWLAGSTDQQLINDAKAILSVSPEEEETFFDEKGELTKKGAGAWAGLKRGIDQLQDIGYGLGIAAADVVGAEETGDWLFKRMEANQAELAANPAEIGSFSNIGRGYPTGPAGALPRLRQTLTYGMEAVTQNLPSMTPTLGTSAVSGAIAKRMVRKGIEKIVEEKLAEAALKAAEKKIMAAQIAGAWSGGAAVETGAIYSEMAANGNRGPMEALVAAAGGTLAGALEAVEPMLVLSRIGKGPIKSPLEKFIRSTMGTAFAERGIVRLGAAGFEGMLTESGTEYLQTWIEQAATLSQDPKTQGRFWDTLIHSYKLQKERMEAAIQGGIAGGAMVSFAEVVGQLRAKVNDRADRKAFELGVKTAMERFGQPVDVPVVTKGGTRLVVPTIPSATGRTAAMAPVPGVQGGGLVQQALAMGLTRTAAAMTRQPIEAIDLTAPGVPGVAAPTSLTPTQAAARQVVTGEEPPAPAPITPGASTTPSPTVQPAPAEEVVAPPPASEAPGVSPAPTPAPPSTTATTEEVTTSPAPETPPADAPYRFDALKANLARVFPHLSNIEVVENGDQFPEDVKREIAARGHTLNAVDAFYWNGRIIFNASKFPSAMPNLVYEKVVHEVAIHLGLRQALGERKFNRLVKTVWNNLSPTDRAAVAARNKILPKDIRQIGEEWLAYEAERVATDGRTNGIWTKIASAVRVGLRTLGFRMKLSDVEIARLIAKGFRAAETAARTPVSRVPTALESVTRLASEPSYPPGAPLTPVGQIRFSFADVQRAKLEGVREYVPETVGAGMKGAFEAVKSMLYREAALLSDLIPPSTSWWQPKQDQSLIEYLRRYYSPEGLALLRQTFARDTALAWVKNIEQWARIKEELTAIASGDTDPNLGLLFLSGNRKTGGVSLDFGLGTCLPTENCSVCYAKGGVAPLALAVARTRHSIVSGLYPEKVADRISDYIKSRTKGDLPFLRVNGSGDTTFQWQADIVNRIAKNIDRPIHVFSRSHVSRAAGTIGLDSITNGQFDPADVENGVAVYKMGSIDAQLMDEYGIDFLRENLEKRGIINAYLVKDANDIPRMLELRRQGVYFVMHINAKKSVIRALKEAGLLATQDNLARDPGLVSPACPCALETGPFLNGCATCLVAGGPCFAMGSQIAMSENGVLVPIKFLLDGKTVPPPGRLVEMSRVGVPREEAAMTAEVAARAYEMAAAEIPGKISKAEREEGGFTINNPRDKTPILECRTEDDFDDALDIADQWKAYAQGLRELVKSYREGTGWERLLAEKQLKVISEEQQAQTDSQRAVERAAQNAFRTSVTEGQETIPEPIGQATPGILTPTRGTIVRGRDEAVEGHDEAYATRFSTTRPLSIANADMQTVLREAGMPGVAQMLGITESKRDQDLLKAVQAKMAADHSWVDRIIEREEKQPGMISDEEALALDFWVLQLRTLFEQEATAQAKAIEEGRPDYAAIHAANAEFWSKPLQRVALVTKRSGTAQGRAFRARQLALAWDFTLSSLVNKKREAVGWRDLTTDEMADLAKTAADYKRLSDTLAAENAKLRARDVDAEIKAAKEELAKINPRVLEYAKEWVADMQNRAKNAKDRLKVKWERFFPGQTIRTSATGPGGAPQLPDELLRELAIIGAAKLAANITDQAAWEQAMVDETGEVVRPFLGAARAASEAFFAERLAAGRAEAKARRAPRKVPTAPGAPPTPTIDDRIKITKDKIRTVVDKASGSAAPIKTAEDDLYYAVQELVRELVEQDPIITRDDLITQVHNILLETLPDMTREETMDAISGRGRIRTPDPEAIATTIRDLKAQIRIASHILDIEARRPRKKTGFQYDKPTDEQRRLLQKLEELKRRIGEVVTDPAAQLASYLDSRKTWYRNRISDLRHEITTRELIVKTKSPSQTDPELEALRAEYDQVRKEHDAIFVKPELTNEQRLVLAERAAERIILKLEKDLAEGRKTAGPKPERLTSDRLEALRTRIIQLKAEQEWAQRHMNPPPDLQDPADIRRWFALDKSIRKIEEQLANQNPFGPGKRVAPVDKPSNQRLAEKLEDLKRQRKEMRDRMGPGKRSPLEQAIYNRMGQLKRQIADYESRLAARDFSVRRRPEPTDLTSNPEALKLLVQRNQIVREFYRALEKDRWEQLTKAEKVWKGMMAGRRAMVNLASSADYSAMRQGLLGILSLASRFPFSPFRTSKVIGSIFQRMFQGGWNRDVADGIMQKIKARKNAISGADRIAGIEYSDIEAEEFTRQEENARSVFDDWAKLPYWEKGKKLKSVAGAPIKFSSRVVAGSNRAFATFLNLTRAALFDELLDTNFKDRAPTDNELRVLGNWVNVATGRGKINPAVARGLSEIIWAPKLLASRLQFLIGQPLWGGGTLRDSARVRAIIAKEYARVIASGTILALVASMFDDKKEKSMIASDFGKIVRGNTRIDLWGGLQQMTVLLSRMASGKTKTLKGKTIDLTARNNYGQGDLYTVLSRFLRTKVRPDIGIALDALARGDFRGEPMTVAGVAQDLLVPLPFRDIGALLKDRGFTEAMIITALNQFGAGVSVYEPSGKRPPPQAENRAQR